MISTPGVPPVSIRVIVRSAGVPPVSIRVIVRSAGVPPVSARVIVRSAGVPPVSSAHSALAREQAPWTRALTRYSRNRSLRSLCTRKEALQAATGIKVTGNRTVCVPLGCTHQAT